ncbi:hypothetical protein MUK42_33141 [Musa troglodytarum]|uniref:Uncharacterized protein n=1 Tax=Musa troglodytarum TaxID=320322 RepID=A0A9E7EVS2_9LILI|nr:hypothetical protein MUK42_33141 [Musa troglodytarum]URD82743.1 hypothetical protein MUK42_33141 [Musa troglodytarum]
MVTANENKSPESWTIFLKFFFFFLGAVQPLVAFRGKFTLTHRTLRPLCCSPSSESQLLCFTSPLLASPPPSTRSTLAAKEVELAHLCPEQIELVERLVQRGKGTYLRIAADAEDDLKESSDGRAVFSSSQDSRVKSEISRIIILLERSPQKLIRKKVVFRVQNSLSTPKEHLPHEEEGPIYHQGAVT